MKPRIINYSQLDPQGNPTVTEYETEDELDAAIAIISPTDSTVILNFLKSLEHEQIGKNVIKDLYLTLRNQNLTQAQEGDLLSRLNGVFMALGFGFIRGARVIANNLVVAGQLTQGRKDYLISKIDEAILLL